MDRPSTNHLDPLLEQSARLKLAAHLARSGRETPFPKIQNALGMTAGGLSFHSRILEEAGYIESSKSFGARRPQTILSITEKGRAAFFGHMKSLASMTTMASMAETSSLEELRA